MSHDTGGPAFPTRNTLNDGMTLRDYFAAKAMQAMLANSECALLPVDEVVPAAYKMADAMLKERNK